MTVKLRHGIFWSDGIPFSADDVVYTIETHLKTKGLRWSGRCRSSWPAWTKTDANTVVFKLKKPNSRFHALFTVRWNAMWMMPKHVFEKAGDPRKFPFNPPVTLGAYTLHGFDPNGKWFIWQMRDDWQRTSLGKWGKPGPKYVSYIDPGPPDKRVILQLNHQLDVIHDTSPEGRFTLVRRRKPRTAGSRGFPYAHPGPDAAGGDLQSPGGDVRESRRALGAGAADRHEGGGHGLLSRRGHHLGDRRAADRRISASLFRADGAVAEGIRARHRQAEDQAVRPDRRRADRGDAASFAGQGNSVRSRADRQRPSVAAGGNPIRRRRPSCWSAPASPSAAIAGTGRTASRSPSTSPSEGECARR